MEMFWIGEVVKKPKYDESLRNYFLGPLGQVADNYYEFIQDDLDNPSKILGEYYVNWHKEFEKYRRWNSLAGSLPGKLYRKVKEVGKQTIKRIRR